MDQFSVVGPLAKAHGLRERDTAFAADGSSIAFQYARCRSDTEPCIQCFEVRSDEGAAGFLGLALSSEDVFQGKVLCHSSVEYIFVKPGYRQLGLSTLLMERAFDIVCRWLETLKTRADEVEYQSLATFESSLGRRVVTHWDVDLREFCISRGFKFWAASLAELDAFEGD